jgi:hypothetical protein
LWHATASAGADGTGLQSCRWRFPTTGDGIPLAFSSKVIAQRVILDDGGNLVGHFIYVPEIYLQAVAQHFANSRLFGNQRWCAVADCFERRQAEWFGNTTAYEQIADAAKASRSACHAGNR